MAVSYISQEEASSTNPADPQDITVTIPANTRGVVVRYAHVEDSTDYISTMTIGGVSMTRVRTAAVTVLEPGRCDVWFLGTNIPAAGAQTLSIDYTSDHAADTVVNTSYLGGNSDLEVVDSEILESEAAIDPTLPTLSYGGRTCIAIGLVLSGHDVHTNVTVAASLTSDNNHDFGTMIVKDAYQTTPGSTDFAMAYTATIEETAAIAVAISEVLAGMNDPMGMMGLIG